MHNRIIRGMGVSLSALAIAAAPVWAQDVESVAEEELVQNAIVVTGTKREETIQDVPFSINAQTGEDILRTGAQNLEDVSRNVAGLTIQNLGPGQSQVAVRGVSAGQIVRDQPGVKEQVGIYLDESVISLSLFTPDLDLFDLNRVETLRGPQGTLFGSGSVGGTVRYITNQPNLDEFEGLAEANVNTVSDGGVGGHVKGAVNIPLIEGKAAIRAVGYYTEYAGFIDAITPTGVEDDVNDGQRFGGRIALTYEPTPNIRLTPRVIYQDISVDGFNRQDEFNILANPSTIFPTAIFDGPLGGQAVLDLIGERQQFLLLEEGFDDETLIADFVAEFDLGPVTLTSVSSFIDRDIVVSRDASALTGSVSLDLEFGEAAAALPSNLIDTTDFQAFTQEVRLSSNTDSRLQWLVGGFYHTNDRDYSQFLPTPGYDAITDAVLGEGTAASVANGFPADSPFNSSIPFDLDQWAIFGEASYDLTEKLTVSFGGRYYDFDEERDFVTGGLFANSDNVTDTTESDGFTPRFLARYEVNDSVTLNAQASRGFRLGGVNDPLNLPLCSPEDAQIFGTFQDYDDETLWNYEAGFKVQKERFSFNAAGFYNDIEDLQVTLDAGSCSSRVVFNVPDAFAAGLEYEVGVSPVDGLDLFVAGSLIRSEFDSTVTDGDGNVLAGLREGNRLPSVPEFQTSASAIYNFDPGIFVDNAFVAASVQYVGTRFTQPSDQEVGQGLPTATGLTIGGFTGDENPSALVDLELDDFFTLNLSAGLDYQNVALSIYLNNVFDENAPLGFDRERGGRARLGFNVSQPRTFGVTARVRF
ncbi:MAG: TonB-dependent receptor [Pseudomonadota bacterium]